MVIQFQGPSTRLRHYHPIISTKLIKCIVSRVDNPAPGGPISSRINPVVRETNLFIGILSINLGVCSHADRETWKIINLFFSQNGLSML